MLANKASRLAEVSRWGRYVQCFVAALAAIAQFNPGGWSYWAPVGVGATVVFLLIACAMLRYEPEASAEIARAQENLQLARTKLQSVRELESQLESASRSYGIQLQLLECAKLFRNVIETAAAQGIIDEIAVCRHMLNVGGNSLARASGFETQHDWTVTIYRAVEVSPGKMELTPVAQERAVKCDLSDARCWPAGVGMAGRCLAEKREIASRDIWEGETLGAQTVGVSVARPHDRTQYRSMFVTPISVQPNAGEPWGVVCASTNTVGHFHRDSDNTNDQAEATRILAKMFELGILVTGLNRSAAQHLVGGS